MNNEGKNIEIEILLKEGKYNFAEKNILESIDNANIKQVEDENNTHYCCKNYIELLLISK